MVLSCGHMAQETFWDQFLGSESAKFVDDGSIADNVNLKTCLIPAPSNQPRPLSYHERTFHFLPSDNNLLQYFLEDTEKFTTVIRKILQLTTAPCHLNLRFFLFKNC